MLSFLWIGASLGKEINSHGGWGWRWCSNGGGGGGGGGCALYLEAELNFFCCISSAVVDSSVAGSLPLFLLLTLEISDSN